MTNTAPDWNAELAKLRQQHAELAGLVADIERDRRALVLGARVGPNQEQAKKGLAAMDARLSEARHELDDIDIAIGEAEHKRREAAQAAAVAAVVERNARVAALARKRQEALQRVEKALAEAGLAAKEAEALAVQISGAAGKPRFPDQPLGETRFQVYLSREIRRHLLPYMTPDAGKPDPWQEGGYPALSQSTANEHLEYLVEPDEAAA